MFDSADDFKYVDVSRVRIDGVKILPERTGDGCRAMCFKDTAFCREAFHERNRIRIVDDSSFEKEVIAVPARVDVRNMTLANWDTTVSHFGNLLGTATTKDQYVKSKWWHYDGIGYSSIEGVIVNNGESDGKFYGTLRDSADAIVHQPRSAIRTKSTSFGLLPILYPLMWLEDEYYAIKMADATWLSTPPAGNYSGDMTRTITTVKTDRSTGEESTSSYTYKTDTIGCYHHISSNESSIEETTGKMDSVSGSYTYVFSGVKFPSLIEKARFFFVAYGQRSAGYVNADKNWVYPIEEKLVQMHSIELVPSAVDDNAHTVTFTVSAKEIDKFGTGLSTTIPDTTGHTVETRYVSVEKNYTPQFAVFKFKLRTGMADIDWKYEPDDSKTMP